MRSGVLLMVAFAVAIPHVAWADSNNGNSSQGSNGSGDSSKSSGDSSKNSGDSSKSSGNSTQNSPKNSSDSSSKGTTDESTNSKGGHAFSIALGVIAVGATVVGVMVLVSQTERRAEERAATALATFMRRNHPLVTHDMAVGHGPILDAWSHDLGLSADERRSLARLLAGSAEQAALMDALDAPSGRIEAEQARRFAGAFVQLTARAIGPARTHALVERATGPLVAAR